jgi:hypothetical protein
MEAAVGPAGRWDGFRKQLALVGWYAGAARERLIWEAASGERKQGCETAEPEY